MIIKRLELVRSAIRLLAGYVQNKFNKPEYPYVALDADNRWVLRCRGKWHTEDEIRYYMTAPAGVLGLPGDDPLFKKMLHDLHRGIARAKAAT